MQILCTNHPRIIKTRPLSVLKGPGAGKLGLGTRGRKIGFRCGIIISIANLYGFRDPGQENMGSRTRGRKIGFRGSARNLVESPFYLWGWLAFLCLLRCRDGHDNCHDRRGMRFSKNNHFVYIYIYIYIFPIWMDMTILQLCLIGADQGVPQDCPGKRNQI